jgi:hypothetical protein
VNNIKKRQFCTAQPDLEQRNCWEEKEKRKVKLIEGSTPKVIQANEFSMN